MPVLNGLVKAGSPEWTEQFDFGATVHDDLEASSLGKDSCCFVAHADLHPDYLGADFDGLFGDGISVL